MNSEELPKEPNINESNEDANEDLEINLDDLDSVDEEVIEIDMSDDDIAIVETEVEADKKEDDSSLDDISKHKESGKHALKYDTIFKGKKTILTEEDPVESSPNNENWMPDVTTNFHYEVYNNERYIREKDLKEKVYKTLSISTDIDFECNRRKPSRVDFNNYFFIVKTELKNDNFTNIELFNELAYYFSDNLMNMFKLLDNKWRNLIIDELQEHIGKVNSDKTILHRNMPVGSEVEFIWADPITLSELMITGEVRGFEKCTIQSYQDIEEYVYIVNSYENEYQVTIDKITKILNNTKFKYNLNKLNNIDFL